MLTRAANAVSDQTAKDDQKSDEEVLGRRNEGKLGVVDVQRLVRRNQ